MKLSKLGNTVCYPLKVMPLNEYIFYIIMKYYRCIRITDLHAEILRYLKKSWGLENSDTYRSESRTDRKIRKTPNFYI